MNAVLDRQLKNPGQDPAIVMLRFACYNCMNGDDATAILLHYNFTTLCDHTGRCNDANTMSFWWGLSLEAQKQMALF